MMIGPQRYGLTKYFPKAKIVFRRKLRQTGWAPGRLKPYKMPPRFFMPVNRGKAIPTGNHGLRIIRWAGEWAGPFKAGRVWRNSPENGWGWCDTCSVIRRKYCLRKSEMDRMLGIQYGNRRRLCESCYEHDWAACGDGGPSPSKRLMAAILGFLGRSPEGTFTGTIDSLEEKLDASELGVSIG